MSLVRSLDLRRPAALAAASGHDRLTDLATLAEGDERHRLLDLAAALLLQVPADDTPWRPRTMQQWLT
jgi:hypothetical protein